MIEMSGLRVPLKDLDGSEQKELSVLRRLVARRLHVKEHEISTLTLRRRSIDARKRSQILLTYTVRVSIKRGEAQACRRCKGARLVGDETPFELMSRVPCPLDERPVVVGAGCAGLFCALSLASAGWRPLLVERGDGVRERTAAVDAFAAGGPLDPESNIQFGLGGAGTFSDGKLQTGTKSPAHRLILETLADAGAARRILWDAKPHVGSDVLPGVVDEIRQRIIELGGEVELRCALTGIEIESGAVRAVSLTKGGVTRRVPTSDVVLACGHSARDVFSLLKEAGVALERKTFAMGVRIEHAQASIDRALYGTYAGHPALRAAPYKLSCHLEGGRSAFSFCMCPGGYVVAAASEPGGVVTNGMSLSARAGKNANAGLLANVFPDDLPGDDVLAGVELQRSCERAAFERAGGTYAAPAQLAGDLLAGVPSSEAGSVTPTYPRGVAWGSLEGCLPDYVTSTLASALPVLEHKLHGFAAPDAVLTGVECRSSSPVRVTRGPDFQSVSTRGLWPCGEGAGYAGGIMSAATDGLTCAEALVRARS